MFETKCIPCMAMDPSEGHTEPQLLPQWLEAMAEGWEPAGPSLQVITGPTRTVVVFGLVKRRVAPPRLNLEPFAPGAVDE